MKKILITGKNSYIGNALENWLMKDSDIFIVDSVDMKDGTWKDKNFSKYDVIIHVAGIAHIKETRDNQKLYYTVNRDLAFETAKKAKSDSVPHFIFLSSMSVYGIESGMITDKTEIKPTSAYGKSKHEAEQLINSLQDDTFSVAIIRPPMVYGNGCKGNYQRLLEFSLVTPIFPLINNKRSMIYIDNLSEFIKQLIMNKDTGIFFPQNKEYVNTSEMVKLIAWAHDRKIKMTKLFNPLINSINIRLLNKIFGDLIYEMGMSEYSSDYRIFNFEESIMKTEEMKK